MADKQRNYGIDLLRIVLMYMVCLIHALGCGKILTNCKNGTPQFYVLWLFESFAFCAVDAFGIISGYMSTSSKSRTSKIVEMWFQVFFYSFILTILLLACGVRYDMSIADIMKCMIPMTTRVYWYFSGYFVLFFCNAISISYCRRYGYFDRKESTSHPFSSLFQSHRGSFFSLQWVFNNLAVCPLLHRSAHAENRIVCIP